MGRGDGYPVRRPTCTRQVVRPLHLGDEVFVVVVVVRCPVALLSALGACLDGAVVDDHDVGRADGAEDELYERFLSVDHNGNIAHVADGEDRAGRIVRVGAVAPVVDDSGGLDALPRPAGLGDHVGTPSYRRLEGQACGNADDLPGLEGVGEVRVLVRQVGQVDWVHVVPRVGGMFAVGDSTAALLRIWVDTEEKFQSLTPFTHGQLPSCLSRRYPSATMARQSLTSPNIIFSRKKNERTRQIGGLYVCFIHICKEQLSVLF